MARFRLTAPAWCELSSSQLVYVLFDYLVNHYHCPILFIVTFSLSLNIGGRDLKLYNRLSSPVLFQIVFDCAGSICDTCLNVRVNVKYSGMLLGVQIRGVVQY